MCVRLKSHKRILYGGFCFAVNFDFGFGFGFDGF